MQAYYCGYGGHGQLGNECLKSTTFVKIGSDITNASCCWSNIIVVHEPGNKAVVKGFLDDKINLSLETELPNRERFKQVLSCRERILALSVNGEAWELKTDTWCPLKIANNTSKIDKLASSQHATLAIIQGQLFDVHSGSKIEIPGQVVDIACGAEHSIILNSEADVYTWGSSLRGQLGRGDLGDSKTPVVVEALSGLGVKQVSAGTWHSAVVTNTGDVYCWGWNRDGQLGFPCPQPVASPEIDEDVTVERISVLATPHPVDIPIGIQQVACGSRHTLALADDGTIWGSGWALYGQLGEQRNQSLSSFTLIQTIPESCKVRHIVAGGWGSIVIF